MNEAYQRLKEEIDQGDTEKEKLRESIQKIKEEFGLNTENLINE